MTYALALTERAKADIANAVKWYESQRNGLGRRFLASLRKAQALLEALPMVGVEVRFSLRRMRLNQFPYSLYYRVAEQRITVHAVLHDRRSPRTWHRR